MTVDGPGEIFFQAPTNRISVGLKLRGRSIRAAMQTIRTMPTTKASRQYENRSQYIFKFLLKGVNLPLRRSADENLPT